MTPPHVLGRLYGSFCHRSPSLVRTEGMNNFSWMILYWRKLRCLYPKIDADLVAGSGSLNRFNSSVCTGVCTLCQRASSRWSGVLLGSTVFMQANNRKYTYTKIIKDMYNKYVTSFCVVELWLLRTYLLRENSGSWRVIVIF